MSKTLDRYDKLDHKIKFELMKNMAELKLRSS